MKQTNETLNRVVGFKPYCYYYYYYYHHHYYYYSYRRRRAAKIEANEASPNNT